MLFGIAVATRPEFQSADDDASALFHINSIIAHTPIAVGIVLTLLGGMRMSMRIKPLTRTLLGVGFLLGVVAVPALAIQLNPNWAERGWAMGILIPLLVFGILGLIFVAMALSRTIRGHNG